MKDEFRTLRNDMNPLRRDSDNRKEGRKTRPGTHSSSSGISRETKPIGWKRYTDRQIYRQTASKRAEKSHNTPSANCRAVVRLGARLRPQGWRNQRCSPQPKGQALR